MNVQRFWCITAVVSIKLTNVGCLNSWLITMEKTKGGELLLYLVQVAISRQFTVWRTQCTDSKCDSCDFENSSLIAKHTCI